MLLPLLLLQVAAAQPAAPDSVPGRGAPEFPLPRLEVETRVDGVLDEPAWAQAARLVGFHAYEPADGSPAQERTEVLVWYAPDALHVGVRAYDSRPRTVRATLADRDNIGQEDRVTLYLDTFDDRRRAFLFAVNPLGVQQDGVRAEGSGGPGRAFGGGTDLSPDYQWESAGRRTAWGWEAELRIPFKSLRYAGGDVQRWGLQVTRHVQRTGREDAWTDVRRGAASFLAQSGTMTGIRDIERGVVLEAQPFVTASSRAGRASPSAPIRRDDVVTSTGANARLGFASAALDLTVNPDFSQVESDAGLVTANERFSLFVPERRPFFLEGIELFASPNQLVYTRRVADPVAGAKLTGKVGPWGYAYLAALDETPGGGTRDALFNVLRLRRDAGRNSLVGLTLTDRRAGGLANTVAAADARIVFGKYVVEAQAGGSRTDLGPPPPVTIGDPTLATVAPMPVDAVRSGGFWSAEVDRTGRAWGFNYSIESFDDRFRTDAGFIPRTGIVSARAFNRLTWFGRPGAALETVVARFGPSYLWRGGALGEGPLEGEENVTVVARLRGGWELETRVARAFADFLPEDYAGYEVGDPVAPLPFAPAAGVRGLLGTNLEVTTPVFRRFNASIGYGRGAVPLFAEAAEGRGEEIELGLDLRPTTQLRGELSAVWQTLERRDGSEFARTVIPRLRLEYQPRRSLFFRTIAQYRAERRAALVDPATGRPILDGGEAIGAFETNGLRLEWLASFEPTPGTVAFLGYAVDLTEPDPLAFGRLRATGDGAFLKLAYLFRR